MTDPISVHLLTCPARAASLAATLASWRGSDWGAEPLIYCDREPERAGEEWGKAARNRRLTDAFAGMLRGVCAEGGDEKEWLLFIEDDLAFHPRIGSLVRSWAALGDERCVLASLFNPSLAKTLAWGTVARAFAAEPKTFLGAQALLLRRGAIQWALKDWDSVSGMQSQRLARIIGDKGPIWIHRPSLVQHVAENSSWGAHGQRALDFDPRWWA